MDLNISSNGGNSSAINFGVPKRPKVKPITSKQPKKLKIQSKKQIKKGRTGTKKRPLGYKQNLG